MLPIAVTMGDPAGIGPDIVIAAEAAGALRDIPLLVLADPDVLAERARLLGVPVALETVADAREVPPLRAGQDQPPQRLYVLPVRCSVPAIAGRPDTANAAATIDAISRAVTLVAEAAASAVVTAPIAKHVLHQAGFAHPGHTEFLAELAGRHWPGTHKPVMMLASRALRVVPVTVHIPLAQVPSRLTTALIVETGRITLEALRRDFGIARPRLAVTGLNPHAGEGGSLGSEDADIIAPAVAMLAETGVAVSGPHPADTLFHTEARRRYDAVLAMYHDQALIPLKTLAFDEGVNLTLGLPFVRTSPDHGTAFDIAGTGAARATSFIEAVRLAAAIAARRQAAS